MRLGFCLPDFRLFLQGGLQSADCVLLRRFPEQLHLPVGGRKSKIERLIQ